MPISSNTLDNLRKKCLFWLRKQCCSVVLEDISNFHVLAWKTLFTRDEKHTVSSGIYLLPDRESVEQFNKFSWPTKNIGQYRTCLTFPGVIKNTEVPSGWGIVEYYNGEFMEKRRATAQPNFDEMAELELLGHLLTMTDIKTPHEDILSIVNTFRECFGACGLNDNVKDLADLVSSGKFHYLFRGVTVE